MNKSQWSLSEAKDHLSQPVEAARRGQPQTVTRHGKAAVVVVKGEDYARKQASAEAPKKNFIEHLMSMPDNGEEFERMPFEPRDIEF